MAVKLRGAEQIIKNLNKEIRKIKGKTRGGISAALTHIQGQAMALTPIDESNLIKSYYKTTIVTVGKQLVGEVGNFAEYAVFVHEDLEARHTVGQAKYLEDAIANNRDAILSIIRSRLRV